MNMRRVVLGLVLALAALSASPAGAAQWFNYGTDGQTHVYCPRGGTLYFGLFFGYWCEDSTFSGVDPIACKSGPGMEPGTWNNGSLTPDQLCRAPGAAPPAPAATN